VSNSALHICAGSRISHSNANEQCANPEQVETLLKTQDPEQQPKSATDGSSQSFPSNSVPTSSSFSLGPDSNIPVMSDMTMPAGTSSLGGMTSDFGTDSFAFGEPTMPVDSPEAYPWEMIGLGLDEPLPAQETMDDLYVYCAPFSGISSADRCSYRIYFEKVHPSIPMMHRPRFYAALNLSPQMRPPIGLRYAMWTMAASVTDKYEALAEHFYHRARKYLQSDEMKGHGEGVVSVQHCQAWVIVCVYEFKNMYFPRAWQSTGRGVRMAQMLGLSRIDGFGLDVKQCLPPPKDWIEREERRRTFWMAFCEDRYASVGTGWPMTIDERDVGPRAAFRQWFTNWKSDHDQSSRLRRIVR
jgi:hypothetical protein